MTKPLKEVKHLIKESKKRHHAIQKEYQEKQQALLKIVFLELFNAIPEISHIAWSQYTPHFNDGDECVFRRNDFYFLTSREADLLREEGETIDVRQFCREEIGHYMSSSYTFDKIAGEYDPTTASRICAAAKKWDEVLEEIDDEIWEATFGDHVGVLATREGFEIDEYEHD